MSFHSGIQLPGLLDIEVRVLLRLIIHRYPQTSCFSPHITQQHPSKKAALSIHCVMSDGNKERKPNFIRANFSPRACFFLVFHGPNVRDVIIFYLLLNEVKRVPAFLSSPRIASLHLKGYSPSPNRCSSSQGRHAMMKRWICSKPNVWAHFFSSSAPSISSLLSVYLNVDTTVSVDSIEQSTKTHCLSLSLCMMLPKLSGAFCLKWAGLATESSPFLRER